MFTSPKDRFHTLLFILTFAMFTAFFDMLPANAAANDFDQGLEKLTQRNFKIKIQGLEQIFQSEAPQVETLLSALLEGDLYYTKKEKEVVYAAKQDGQFTTTGVLSNEVRQGVGSRTLKKIGINNNIRKKLKGWLSLLQLYHGNPKERTDAVYRLLGKLTPEMVNTLKKRYDQETSHKVKQALATAIALDTLDNGSDGEKQSALHRLKGSLYPAVKTSLLNVINNENSEQVKNQARKTLQGIESKIAFFRFTETLFFGLSAGSILVLAAIGLAITFGVIGVINMAHG
ncbi:MAG: hypothetical protein MI799_14845, partial [Desulfobacterales bacterium]|nr:hypothetical protein [Desulfobacterales bacterium]